MMITQKQLLGYITFLSFVLFYLISYNYIVIKLGPKLKTTKQPIKPKKSNIGNLIPETSTPSSTINIKQTDLTNMNESDIQNTLLTPASERAPTTYEAALNEATEPVIVLDFPIPIEPKGIDNFQNIN